MTTRKPKTSRPKPQKEKWFKPGIPTGWSKDLSQQVRRKKALEAHKSDLLGTARSLQALANVTTNKITKKLARQDAVYFFKKYQKEKNNV